MRKKIAPVAFDNTYVQVEACVRRQRKDEATTPFRAKDRWPRARTWFGKRMFRT
jgi:hypothetical protein